MRSTLLAATSLLATPALAATTTPQILPFDLTITAASAAFEVQEDVNLSGFDAALGTLTGVNYALDVTSVSSTALADDFQEFSVLAAGITTPFLSFNGVFEGVLPFIDQTSSPDDFDSSRLIDSTDIAQVLLDRYTSQAIIVHRFQLANPNAFRDAAIAGTLTVSYEFDPAEVPLPGGLVLLVSGLGLLGLGRVIRA